MEISTFEKENSESSYLALYQAYTIRLHLKGPSWPIHTPPYHFFCVINMSALSSDQPVVPTLLPFLPCQPSCMEESLINVIKPRRSLSNAARNVSFPGITIGKHVVVNIMTFFNSVYFCLIIFLVLPCLSGTTSLFWFYISYFYVLS